MKYCPYCRTKYDSAKEQCPSCHARNYETICDKCGTLHSAEKCPTCGQDVYETLRKCPKCGMETRERVCPRCGNDVAAVSTLKDSVASVASKAACKIVGHDFYGCKCVRCGEIQDKDHDLEQIPGQCKARCTVCGKIVDSHDEVGKVCRRCGKKKGFFGKWS